MRPFSLAWVSLVLVAAPTAQAFSSVSPGHSPHDEITALAAEFGWPEGAVEALQEDVRQADITDFKTVKVKGEKDRIEVLPAFHAWHHCDREPPASDLEAFQATVDYIAWEADLAENLSLIDPAAAMRAMGRALHALQDCYSHSNIVDLDPAAHAQMQDALLGAGPAPAGLILAGSQPGLPEIGNPPGDPYPHDHFNKDDVDSAPESAVLLSDGRTKHEAARDLATNATAAFLTSFMARLDADESKALLAVEPAKADGKDAKGIPGSGPWLLFAVPLAALLRRR